MIGLFTADKTTVHGEELQIRKLQSCVPGSARIIDFAPAAQDKERRIGFQTLIHLFQISGIHQFFRTVFSRIPEFIHNTGGNFIQHLVGIDEHLHAGFFHIKLLTQRPHFYLSHSPECYEH